MKIFNIKTFFILFSFIAVSCQPNLYDTPIDKDDNEEVKLPKTSFSRGVNLAGCFEVPSDADAEAIWMGDINSQTFTNLKELGCDVVRVPMDIRNFVVPGSPTYELQKTFFDKLDRLLDLGENHGLTVIVDNHVGGNARAFPDDKGEAYMTSIWKQIALHCKDRSEKVVYELQNEPDESLWKDFWPVLQGKLIEAIREIDKQHSIIVSAAPGGGLADLPEYEDDNLIYTIHCYTPFVFTHQGASWINSGLEKLGGKIPFPCPSGFDTEKLVMSLKDEANRKQLSNYSYTGTEDYIKFRLDRDISEARRRNVPLFMGEFGVLGFTGVPNEDRCRWHEVVRTHAEANNVSWTIWTYSKEFGLFTTKRHDPVFEYDLNVDLLKALGLNIPASYTEEVDESTFIKRVLYDDNYGEGLKGKGDNQTYLTVPCVDNPATGNNCIKFFMDPNKWKGRYLTLTFTVNNGHEDYERFDINKSYIRFKVRGIVPKPEKFSLEIWAIDDADAFNEPEARHNWVKMYNLTESNFALDGEWHDVSIPLKVFKFRNSSDSPYIPSNDYFTWSKISQIRFTNSENVSYLGESIYFDDIIITGPQNKYWKPEEPTPDPEEPTPDPEKPDPDKPEPEKPDTGSQDINKNDGGIQDLNILPDKNI